MLTPLCATFVETMNRHDVNAFVALFSSDAAVDDEGATHHGHVQIRAWIENAFARYQPILEVTGAEADEKTATITGPVSGTFDGSPVLLHYHLTFRDGKIATLECDV